MKSRLEKKTNMTDEAQELYDDYREKIAAVEQVSEFSYLKRLIKEDENLIEYGLVDNLLINLAKHRTHMLDRIDEAIDNY